jgi:hypothetical protein
MLYRASYSEYGSDSTAEVCQLHARWAPHREVTRSRGVWWRLQQGGAGACSVAEGSGLKPRPCD